jgi:hypothetical protein
MTRTRLLTQYQTGVIVPLPRPARIARMYERRLLGKDGTRPAGQAGPHTGTTNRRRR